LERKTSYDNSSLKTILDMRMKNINGTFFKFRENWSKFWSQVDKNKTKICKAWHVQWCNSLCLGLPHEQFAIKIIFLCVKKRRLN